MLAESYFVTENFEAKLDDEVSLCKGAVVEVLQKLLDGWWMIR